MLIKTEYLTAEDYNKAKCVLLSLFEKEFLILRLLQYGGNVSAAARASGMTRQNFQRLMKKHNITSKEYRQ